MKYSKKNFRYLKDDTVCFSSGLYLIFSRLEIMSSRFDLASVESLNVIGFEVLKPFEVEDVFHDYLFQKLNR